MPTMLICPNCKEPTFNAWRKQVLGPARAIKCSNCDARISVSTVHSIPVILLAMGIPASFVFSWLPNGYGLVESAVLLAPLFVLVGLYQHFLVPLVVRSRSNIE